MNDGVTLPLPVSRLFAVVLLLSFVAGYALLGIAGLALQSAQTGVTPIWPASGLAFAIAFRYGIPFLFAVFPAMLLIGSYVGAPPAPVLLAALGSFLEAAVPVLLLRRANVHRLSDTRSALLFVLFASVLGPMFSASIGTAGMALFAGLQVQPVIVWLLWWLGNSIGILVVGGFGVLLPERQSGFSGRQLLVAGVFVYLPTVLLTWACTQEVGGVESPLLLYLLIPMVVLVAIRIGLLAVFLVGVTALATLLASGSMDHHVFDGHGLGPIYLNVSLLWLVSFTGVMVSMAWHERATGVRYAWQATHDSVTELINRHEFLARIERALLRVHEQRGEFVLMQVDLDNFKQVNDTFGHGVGDRLLHKVAHTLLGEVRGRDTVARLGGDEFILLLDSCALSDATAIAENIRHKLDGLSCRDMDGSVRISASIGVVKVLPADRSVDELMRRVDQACYAAKRAGRNHLWLDPREA